MSATSLSMTPHVVFTHVSYVDMSLLRLILLSSKHLHPCLRDTPCRLGISSSVLLHCLSKVKVPMAKPQLLSS